MPFLLEIRNVSRHFGGLVALNDVSFGVQRGEIVGLIGPNGAGKSTLFNVITGFFPPSRGRILFKGADIGGLKPHQIARLGIVRTFQLTVLFGQFSVLENVLLGSHLRSRMLRPLFSRRAIPPAEWNRAEEILSFTDLAHLRDQRAADLPHGHQRMLAVAVALGAEPELLLLDEPVTGMTAEEIRAMTALIRSLRDVRGITVLLVEHNVKTIMELCQQVVVISFGRKLCEGRPDEVRRNDSVIEAYLGSDAA